MAAARRLSELLQEQQEPFLLDFAKIRRQRRGGAAVAACRRLLGLCNHGVIKKRRASDSGGSGPRCALSRVLCSNAMRKVLHWGNLGCFSGEGEREFRRLRRSGGDDAMDFDGEEVSWKAAMGEESSRQLSPVSVLELRSGEESPVHCHGEEDEKPSTSGSSPAMQEDLHGITSPCFTSNINDKMCAMKAEEEEARNDKSIEERMTSWEKIARDISKIPKLMELDFSRTIQEWSVFKPEVTEVGTRIETLIFEEIRRETVCDLLASHCTLQTTSC